MNEGKLPLAGTLPPVEMAFLVRCYANCLQPWSSKVSDVVIPFLASASGLGCCRLCVCMCVFVCVCVTERKIGCGWEKLSSIHMHMHFICLETLACCACGCNLNFNQCSALKMTDSHNCWHHAKAFSRRNLNNNMHRIKLKKCVSSSKNKTTLCLCGDMPPFAWTVFSQPGEWTWY